MGCCRPFCAGAERPPSGFRLPANFPAARLSFGHWSVGQPLGTCVRLFRQPCRCIWCARQPAALGHSRRPPISQRRCYLLGIGVSASSSALVSGFFGSPAGASGVLGSQPFSGAPAAHPSSRRRCCPWGIGASASSPALVPGFFGSPASASDARGSQPLLRGSAAHLFFRQLCRRKNSSRGLRGRAKAVPGEFARGTAVPFAPFRTGSKTAGRCRRTAAGRRCCSGA